MNGLTPVEFSQLSPILGADAVNALMQFFGREISALELRCTALESQAQALQATKPIQTVSRTLDTDFVISPTKDARVAYTIYLPIKLTLLGSDEATVALFVNGNEISRVTNQMTLGVGLSVSDTRLHKGTLSGYVPAGATVRVATISASGSADPPSLYAAQEALV